MPRPNAIEASMRFRRQLAQQEATSAERMGNIWLGILRRITPQVEALADDVAAMENPTKGKLTKLARSQRILRQIAEQAARFGQTVTTEVELVQNAAIQQGLDDALRLMELSLPPLPSQTANAITASFTRLPAEAVISAAGLLGDDSPLTMRLQDAYGEFVAKQVEEHLLDGIAAGQNPRRIASLLRRNVQDAAGKGLSSALTTIRTAQIKSYQIANHSQYAANPKIVPEWTWVAALDDRTCMSCVSQHGTTHPYTETMNDHHNGRCAPVPKTISYADLGIKVQDPVPTIETGENWFRRQNAGTQRQMMGKGKFEAWQSGDFEFNELSLQYDDDVYGNLLRENTLKNLLRKRGKKVFPGGAPSEQLAEFAQETNQDDWTPELFEYRNELKFVKANGEFYPGEALDVQDKVNAEETLSQIARSRGFTPNKMTPSQWEDVGQQLQDEATDHLEIATRAGRETAGSRAVGRHFIGHKRVEYMEVGGKSTEVRWAGGSRARAADAAGTINKKVRKDADEFMGTKLVDLGYSQEVIDKTSYTAKRRLLAELGHDKLQKGQIPGVSLADRRRVVANATPQQRVQSLSVAWHPKAGVGLEKWTQYEMSMVKAGKEELIQYPPDVQEGVIPDFVKAPADIRPTVEFEIDF